MEKSDKVSHVSRDRKTGLLFLSICGRVFQWLTAINSFLTAFFTLARNKKYFYEV